MIRFLWHIAAMSAAFNYSPFRAVQVFFFFEYFVAGKLSFSLTKIYSTFTPSPTYAFIFHPSVKTCVHTESSPDDSRNANLSNCEIELNWWWCGAWQSFFHSELCVSLYDTSQSMVSDITHQFEIIVCTKRAT
jgi:hypothetical protein